MLEKNDILVSVCCLAYNQEKYIEECINGFLKQKTDFKFEVIIHDDASTDRTAEIILNFQKKYPDIIKFVQSEENQYAQIKEGGISQIYWKRIYPIAHGKYLAYCEGDDYWSDEYKLQKQVDILERNVDCRICLHKAEVVKENGERAGWGYPQKDLPTGKMNSYDMLKGLTSGYFFHTTSFLCEKIYIDQFVSEMPDFYRIADVDDVPLLLYFGQLGESYYIAESMSCYRRNSVGSWTERQRISVDKIVKHKQLMVKLYEYYDEYTDGKYKDLVEHWINNERFMIAEHTHDFREMIKRQYRPFMKGRGVIYFIKVCIATCVPNIVKRIKKYE